jgi:hydroxyacylglutathione hydrolase
MKVEQIYTKCLAQGSYYIQCCDEAVIIDPLREVDAYIQKAKEDGVTIKYIFETHFHADFVSGHVTLAEKTGAKIVYGPNAKTSFPAHIAKDGEEFELGKVKIKVLHTPGHTMESTTFLLTNKEGKNHAIFTGDTLFLGDVGRPDLAQKGADLTQEDLAGMLFDSLRTKIMPLEDEVIVYPAHGAGSACGKNMMKETVDTLGNQKKMNYALRADMTKEEFIKEVTDGLLPPPAYFPLNVKMNKEGYKSIDDVMQKGLTELSPAAFKALSEEKHTVVLDVRNQSEFVKEHVTNSLFVGLDGGFAPWVGELLVDVKTPIILIAPEGREEEAVTRLARVGFDNTLGFLKGGVRAWKEAGEATSNLKSIPAEQFASEYVGKEELVFDVRKDGEFEAEHVEKAKNTSLGIIETHLSEFPKNEDFYVHCAGGYRSVIAASILKQKGIHNIIDVQGGYDAIKNTNIPLTAYVCPSTL